MDYKTTIGLEVHAELATKSKMFCGCSNQPHGVEVNTNICPVCMAHPGSLPVPNKQAIEMVLTFGAATNASAATYSEFDRKNYFYPDIPKAYQISQYQFPFLTGGEINGVELTRVHLEEDTARSSHELEGVSLVDFNRAGVPLMELVTEPVIHSAPEAGAFARELQLILQTLGISDANMERGEMRIEANVSISKTDELGTKVEVKNINSFKAVEAAIAYEVARQAEVLEAGETVMQETRGWDENKSRTFSQRTKETAKDYRYFPDPDIPKVQVSEISSFEKTILSEKISKLPAQKRTEYKEYGISEETIETLIADRELDSLFAAVCDMTDQAGLIELASNYISVDLAGMRANSGVQIAEIAPTKLIDLMSMVANNDIGSRGAKDLLNHMPRFEGDVKELAKEKGLLQLSDRTELAAVVTEVVSGNPEQVNELRSGKETVLKFLVGQGMKATKGAANPQVLEELLRSEILK